MIPTTALINPIIENKEYDMTEETYGISRDDMIENCLSIFMYDFDEARLVTVECTADLNIEILVHSDGEINSAGHNLLVLVNQPSTGITDAYMTMLHADYDDLMEDHYGNTH
jgi:hypothetical protein